MGLPKFYMLCGISGSGKSSWSGPDNCIKISSDALRLEMFGDETDQTHNSEVFNELHNRVRENLKNGKNVIYDATNLSSRRRKAFLKTITHIPCKKICMVFRTPYEVCVKRDSLRSRTVGVAVIFKQLKQFQMPQYDEGWDLIDFTYLSADKAIDPFALVELSKLVEHDNPHHLESIGQHMQMTYDKLCKMTTDEELRLAGLFHDLGKVSTKYFRNARGEKTDIAHYYSHENVSVYLYLTSCLFYPTEVGLKIAWLIENHMRPYYSGYEKWKSTQKPEWVKDLELLHLADQEARITE